MASGVPDCVYLEDLMDVAQVMVATGRMIPSDKWVIDMRMSDMGIPVDSRDTIEAFIAKGFM